MNISHLSEEVPVVGPSEFKPFTREDSVFRLIVVAVKRNKQLLHGSPSRIDPGSPRRKNINIALEEVKKGLVTFAIERSAVRR